MKNKPFIIYVILFCINILFGFSQNEKVIKVTDSKTVNLFFESPIERAIVGSSNYEFGYNKKNADYIGVIKGSKGSDSNLTVITLDGNIYSFILRYSKSISVLNHFVKEDLSIGNLNNNKEVKKRKEVDSIKKIEREKKEFEIKREKNAAEIKYIVAAKKVINEPLLFRRAFRINDKVKFHVKSIVYDKDQLYFLCNIKNKANVDYDINFIEFYITSKSSGKSRSGQKILMQPAYKYHYKNRIEKGDQNDFVIVFDKFSINKNKLFVLAINEEKGEKNIALALDHEYVNFPKNLNN